MSIGAILSTSVQGMQAQSTRLAASASNIANIDTPAYAPLRTDLSATAPSGVSAQVSASSGDVEETGEMLGIIEAREGFEANASVFDTGASMWDMLMTINRKS